ncbi:hypothetical protein [Tolypothrix sp. VBCCA 56010]|uniref:hypothetical protein n=1 Tax=Tolypothrix sp. VBCCA 56010 TaxID=3137731 RepID=UPI003D7D5AA5
MQSSQKDRACDPLVVGASLSPQRHLLYAGKPVHRSGSPTPHNATCFMPGNPSTAVAPPHPARRVAGQNTLSGEPSPQRGLVICKQFVRL